MASINDFGLKSTDVEEHLPWGGLVRPTVVKQKDNSYFSIIKYKPFQIYEDETLDAAKWSFKRGWVLWNEHQHIKDGESNDYLVICWNPFHSVTNKTFNILDEKKVTSPERELTYFEHTVKMFAEDFSRIGEVKIIEYQELLDVLSFSLSLGESNLEMPDVPLYLDALIANDIVFKSTSNNFYINHKKLIAISIHSIMDIRELYPLLKHVSFRHNKRFICFSRLQAVKQLKEYSKLWFPRRKVIRDMALGDLIKTYNGYYNEALLFLVDKENEKGFNDYLIDNLQKYGVAFTNESFSLKNVFWSTMPGLFLANIRPPVQGFDNWGSILNCQIKKRKDEKDILEEAMNRKIETPVDVEAYINV